jgi:hypothetical protein
MQIDFIVVSVLQVNLKESFKKEETAVWKGTELPSVFPVSLLLEEMLWILKSKYMTLRKQSYCTSKFVSNWWKASNDGPMWGS